MIRVLTILAVICAFPASAEPLFADRSAALPERLIYTGAWEHFVGGGVAVFDCNNDRRPDIFAAGGNEPARLMVNQIRPNADWMFVDGEFDKLTGVTGAYPLDIDSDGEMDLVVLRVGENLLYRGIGDCNFEPANDRWNFDGGDRWTTAFSATWEPGNKFPTLAFGNYVDRSDPDGPFGACDSNQLFRPKLRTYKTPIDLTPGFCALSMLFSDWNKVGAADLRISNDRHYYVSGGYEQMYRLAENRFLTEMDGWIKISIWGMGIASQDLNGDGRPEIELTSMGDQLLQLNTPRGFIAAPYSIGTYAQRPFLGDDGRPSTGWHAEFGDVNNDGLEDLFIAKGNVDQMPSNAMKDPNNLLVQLQDGNFVEMADIAGVATTERSRGAALADFNGDGILDLVVTNRRAPLELYENVSLNTGNWLKVTPRQPGTNGFAVGAWVELRDGQGRFDWLQTREITVGGGHAGGEIGPQHFGTGYISTVDVRVVWPDSKHSNWVNLRKNQSVELWRKATGELRIVTLP